LAAEIVKDFPKDVLDKFEVEIRHPDELGL
jgi:hypothetical protein